MSSSAASSDITALGFMDARAKLIELAAFLDRVERHGAGADYRCEAIAGAVKLLGDGGTDRARRVLEMLSDPTTEPLQGSRGKAAAGVWQSPEG